MIRSLWVVLVGVTLTLKYTVTIVVKSLFGKVTACYCERCARRWGRAIVKASGSTVEIEGLEGYDPDQPHIFVSNHVSWFDVFALCGYVPGNFRFVAKQELMRIPIFGRAFSHCGHVSVDRTDRSAAIESLSRASERIRKEGLDIVMFAEGTRSPDGSLQAFKKGAFVLAIQAGVQVQPIAVLGTREIMPKGTFRIRPGRITLRLGPAIPVEGLEHADRDGLMERTRSAVAMLIQDGPGPEGAASATTEVGA